MNLLEVRNLAKAFHGFQAVDDLSFDLAAGERLAMIGPNGAGKSTCFDLLNGQFRPDRGSIRLAGTEISGWAPRRICRLGVGRTFQISATFASMRALENVQLALVTHGRGRRRLWPALGRQFRQQALSLLERVGLADQAERSAGRLAYGDQKRLELALSLAHRPRLLLLDEPTAGMPAGERRALMQLVNALVAADGISVLFTEHDMDTVYTYASRILVLHRGSVLCSGSAASVRADTRVQDVYLGGSAPFSGPSGHA